MACAVPVGLNVGAANGTQATLAWDAVAGANGYTVEVENTSPNSTPFYIEIKVSGSPYIVTGLLANQAYKFKVRSECGKDHSDWADWYFFNAGGNGGNGGGTGSGACAIPSGLNATATATGIRLSWKPVAGVTTYKIEVENEGPLSAPYHVEVTVNDTVYLPTGLSSNEKYKFKVRSICGNNQSDWSAAFKFATGAGSTGGGNNGPCLTPGGLMVTGTAAGSATLSWNAVAGAASYSIEVENASGNNQFYSFTTTTPNTTFTLTGLGTNLQYKFKVRTNCNSGHSDWSPWLVFNSTSGAGSGNTGCSVPTGLSASVSGGVVTLSWNAVAGALTYTLEVENGQGNNTVFHAEVTVSGGTYQPAGLLANKNYKFKVRANCSGGQSAWSAWQLFNSTAGNVSTTGQCAAPTGLSAVYSDSVAVLSWNAVAGALSYRVEVEDGDHTPPFNVAVTVTGTTYTVTGLASGNVEYKFKVRANCSFLTGAWSSSLFFGSGGNGGGNNGNGGNGGNGGGNCGVASGLGANALTNSAVLSWSAVPGAVSYGIEVEDASGNAAFIFQSATVSGLSYTANGLMSGVSYKFKVRANCASDHGDWSSFFTFQTLHLRPGGIGSGDETTNKHTYGIGAEMAVKVWPMPVQQELNLHLSGLTATTTTVRLYHPTGQLVTSFQFETGAGDWDQTLDLPAMTAGMYLLQVENGGKSRFVKVLHAD